MFIKGSAYWYQYVANLWSSLSMVDPNRFPPTGFFTRQALASFDCSMAIIYGLERVFSIFCFFTLLLR
jgi:hypothetical protein